MDIQFLGLGSAFNPAMGNTNAVFTRKDHFYILDCGETAFGRLWDSPDFVGASQVTVALTHLHCDHVGSLASLISYSYYVLGKNIRVLHPLETAVQLLDLMGIERFCYRHVPQLSGGGEAVSFESVTVEHVDNMVCFGYIISSPEERIYYSGDARFVPDTVVSQFLEGSISRIYQDTALKNGDHPTHGSLDYLESIFPEKTRNRIFCMHLDSDYRDLLREKGFGLAELYRPGAGGNCL
ncbi:MBL fold metallo-hydrolase [Breznakiella homolactica]|uniref:MBL fold metallo-hydrolase n=1 Tax=Breznakiella homolactica TaxID=2798577 RepID=A0A7T7XLU6_9SPIR|nr:MBL fold metallo-hydrolase [Breznakiella homolactica]QQO08602.1 MBL fold metallo-hydrolase [Breznakiella homolactica]